MDPAIVAALIAVAGASVGALSREIVLPALRGDWARSESHDLVGTWDSAWGPMPDGPVTSREVLTVTAHRGDAIQGFIAWATDPKLKWEFEGRYNGRFIQLMYRPAKGADDSDFVDYGCYFLQRRADGAFIGYSTGYGKYDNEPTEGVSTDYHELRRISRR